MFAPKVARSLGKTAEAPASGNASRRLDGLQRQLNLNTAEQVRLAQRNVGNPAIMQLLARRAGNSSATRPTELPLGSGPSRGFSPIPLSLPGRTAHLQQGFPLTAAPFGVIQPKLEVGAVDDPLEREADRVADQVMRIAGPEPIERDNTKDGLRELQRASTSCEEEEKKQLHRKETGVGPTTAPPIVHEVLRSSGQPLDPGTRAFMEPRFGHDFSQVRVHADSYAAESAKAVHALAYTVGPRIIFDAGQYSPESVPGKRLLAHELSHVIQHGSAKPHGRTESGHDSLTHSKVAHHGVYRDTPKSSGSKSPPPVPGGNILYVGVNNYKPEVTQLGATYTGRSVKVSTVTVTEHEEKTQVGGSTFDLTTDDGIHAFANGLPVNGEQVDMIEKLIKDQSSRNRDELAHVISIYATTDDDGQDRLSRVILSGHSYGESVYNEDVKGAIEFKALVRLADIFPKAAAQTRHLLILACLAGDEDLIKNVYQKAFPSLRTFWGWTRATCPTGPGAAAALEKWTKLTDKDPTTLPLPPTTQANWAMGSYQTNEPVDAKALMDGLRADEPKFNEFVNGTKVSTDAHSGFLFDYYQRARTASLHTSEVTGADHDYAQLHADQSYRLRFWPGMVSNFWRNYGTTITKGYGTAKPPNYPALSRKDALAAIANFAAVSTATDADKAPAIRLLTALQNLDASILQGTWITP